MRILNNKKAQGDIESYFEIIKLILAFAAIAAMSAYVYSVASDTFFHKLYFSRDISFTTNTLYSAPGNIYHEYKRDKLDKFEIDFDMPKVKIREKDDKKKGLSFDYFYATDLNYLFKKDEINNKNKIVFQKSADTFEISKELDKRLELIKCHNIYTSDAQWKQKSFLIDLGYKDQEEVLILAPIIFSLYNKFENKDTTISNIETGEGYTKKDLETIQSLLKNSEVIISIHSGDYPSNNNIKIYVSSIGDEELVKKREKLGCLIINELFSDKELNNIFTGGNVISINPKYIKKDYRETLSNDKISIVMEIGNIQSDRIKSLQNAQTAIKISSQIYKGVEKYYD